MTKAYIGGTFDLFHHGHVNLFKQAKKMADVVIVALNTDEFNAQYKGRKPIMSLSERRAMLEACKYVDIVDVNEGGQDSKPAILRNKPDYILHGDDWSGDGLMKQMGLTDKFLKDNNIQMKYVPYTGGVSTTDIIERVFTKRRVIAVDLDGTLCSGVAWTPEDCLRLEPIREHINIVNELYNNNFIVVYTARKDCLIENSLIWLKTNNVKYHAISNIKIPADYYIDDKMITFNDIKL